MKEFKLNQYFEIAFTIVLLCTLEINCRSISSVPQYDPLVGMDNALYSSIAHCTQSQVNSWQCPKCSQYPNMKDTIYFFNESYQAAGWGGYNSDTNEIIVGYRGAMSTVNWVFCLDYFKVTTTLCEGCKVHGGILKTYMSIRDQVIQTVTQLYTKYPEAKIIVTGHSLGGGMAALTALDIDQNVGYVYQLITFASPRMGNKAFAEAINNKIYNVFRVVHYRDPVPHLPPQSFGDEHYATEVWYNNENSTSWVQCQGGEDQNCSDSVHFYQYKPNDHPYYLGIDITC